MRLAETQMPPSLLPTWYKRLHHNNRLPLLSPPHLRVLKAYCSARFFPISIIFQPSVMALRASAQGGLPNRACIIPSTIKEAYLIRQMSPTLHLRISGTVASTATITTVNRLKFEPLVRKATRGHVATYLGRLQCLLRPARRPLENRPPIIIQLELGHLPSYHALSRN